MVAIPKLSNVHLTHFVFFRVDPVILHRANGVAQRVSANTLAELTSRQDGIFCQHLVERLMQEIMKFDDEFRREDAGGSSGSRVRH